MQCQKTNREEMMKKKKLERDKNEAFPYTLHSESSYISLQFGRQCGSHTHGDSKSAFPHEA
jgi:hypothetical protein